MGFLLGVVLILLAFYAGAQKNVFLGLLGFLGFFVAGVTLIIESWKKRNKKGLDP
ncbi:MAG: hypothetical protein HYS55_00430 [Candidatus Omnitrophica bacterium]|nr:hypothetical protein [Candidatus Omnitrophota bacterium]